MTDANLADLGHTRTTYIKNIKKNFLDALDVEIFTQLNKTPVNSSLEGVF